jgi:predicted negative regulator of RcsB-dependent stress response
VSPKNKGKMGKAATAVEPDQFVSGVKSFADHVRPHTKKLIALGVAILVVSMGVIGWRWWKRRDEAKASSLYAQAMDILDRRVKPPPAPPPATEGEAESTAEGEDAEEPPPPVVEEDENEGPSYPSIPERAKAALVPLDTLQSKYGSTKVARGARMMHAATEAAAGNLDEALKLYETVASTGAADLRSLAREQAGYLYERQAMAIADPAAREPALRKAIDAFRAIQEKDGEPRREYALYHEGRMLALLDKRDEAIAMMKKALDAAPESPIHQDIDDRLTLLEAQGAIAAAPPAETAPPPAPTPAPITPTGVQ